MVRGLIGVVHLPPIPGDPAAGTSFARVRERVLHDAAALAGGGVDALLLENFGSAPFVKGTAGARLPPHQVATLAVLSEAVQAEHGLPTGVNCLRSDAISALGIAAAVGLDFVRVNVHVGAYATDQGVIEGEAPASLRYRAQLGADVAILADILVKHAAPLAPLSPERAAHDVLERGLADAVIVTGGATGASVDPALLEVVRAAAGDAPVLIGSGLTVDTVDALAPLADGAIVGTALKQGGDVHAPVDGERVRAMVAALRGRFRG